MSLTMGPNERRLLSSLPGAPQARGIQREYIATDTLVWRLTAAQMAIWDAWWTDDLELGTRWFGLNWLRTTGVDASARFKSAPRIAYSGFERFDVSIAAEIRRSPAPDLETPTDPIVELILEFDETNRAAWPELSPNGRALTYNVPSGSAISSATGGAFSTRGVRFQQLYPGSRITAAYTGTAYMRAAGDIDLGNDDWIIEFVSNRTISTLIGLTANQVGSGMTVLSLGDVNDGESLFIHYRQQIGGQVDMYCSVNELVSGFGQIREVTIDNVGADNGTPVRYTFSRKGQIFTSFREGVVANQSLSAFSPSSGDYIVPPTRGYMRIGCGAQNEIPTLQTIDGYDGILDDIYIAHGPGAGVDANFTRTAPWA